MILDASEVATLIHGCEQQRALMRDALAADESALTGLLEVCLDLAARPGRINRASRATRRELVEQLAVYAALAIAESVAARRQPVAEEADAA